jgi:mannan endo-1,4-beta-mannosidase
MGITRPAIAVAVTAVLAVTVPLAAPAAQATPTVERAAHHVHLTAAHPTHHARARHVKPPASSVLFGLSDHWEPQMEADARQVGARPGIVGTFLNWGTTKASSIVNYAAWANRIKAVPMMDLSPPLGVTLASIVHGSQDATLTADARALHAWNHPFLLRLFPEMNGSWERYAPGRNGNTSRQLVKAWRHVYRLFARAGANRVKFVWNPDKEFSGQVASYRQLWPGKHYVDWVGLDVYNSNDTAHGTYASARIACAPSVKDIRKLTNRPLMVAEIGVADFAGKPHWIRRSLHGMSKLGVKAVVWFNESGHYSNGAPVNWRLDSTPAALRATKATLRGASAVWPGHNHGTLRRDNRLTVHGHY